MWDLKKKIQMNLFKKQKKTHSTENNCMGAKGGRKRKIN